MDAQKSVSMFKSTDFVKGTYANIKYLQARANLSECPLSNKHKFHVWILKMQKQNHKQIGISKQQEAALEKQWGDGSWKSNPKNHTSNNFINYY